MRISRELLRVDEVDSKESDFKTSRIYLLERAGSSGLSTDTYVHVYIRRPGLPRPLFAHPIALRGLAWLCLLSRVCHVSVACASVASSVHIQTLLYRLNPVRYGTSIV